MRPQWIVGDVHGGTDGAADRAFLELLALAAAHRVDLLLMGDLFAAWLGPERFWPVGHRPLLHGLRRLRAAGGRTRFVVGNRDYLVGSLKGDVFDEVFERPGIIDWGGWPTWVLHGDGIVPADRLYRAWRTVSRSPAATAALAAMPGWMGRRLPGLFERGLAQTNVRYKTGRLPYDAIAAVAAEAARAGAHRCVIGHFHRSADFRRAGLDVHVVPGWREHRCVLIADDRGGLHRRSLDALAQRGAVPNT